METSNIHITPSREVRLSLPNQKPRIIGWLSEDGQTFHTQRNPEKHFHHLSESVGFNYELLRDGNFKWIIIYLPFGKELITTRNHILAKGIFHHYKGQGYERQKLLSLSEFGVEKAEATESQMKRYKLNEPQQNLFKEVA